MLKRSSFPVLNDGVAVIYRATDARNAPSLDPSKTDGLEKVAGLAFESKANRQQDEDLADSEGFSLTRKVRVRDMPQLSSSMLVQINGILHEIGYIDRSDTFAYLYLDAVTVDGSVILRSYADGHDDIGNPVKTPVDTAAWCRKRSWKQARITSVSDSLEDTVSCTVRRADLAGQTKLVKDRKTYTVTAIESRGNWVAITATRKAGDR